jgi:hypothetical protein
MTAGLSSQDAIKPAVMDRRYSGIGRYKDNNAPAPGTYVLRPSF